MTGLVLWGLGNVLAGLGTPRLGAPWIYATYGVIGGLGLGLGYVTPVAAVTKWFPDKRGLGSGMVVMGFGLGAFFYNNVLKAIPAFAAASREAARGRGARGRRRRRSPPEAVSTVMRTFVWSGHRLRGAGRPLRARAAEPTRPARRRRRARRRPRSPRAPATTRRPRRSARRSSGRSGRCSS